MPRKITSKIKGLKEQSFNKKYYFFLFLFFSLLVLIVYFSSFKNGFVSDDKGINPIDFPILTNLNHILEGDKIISYLSALVRLVTVNALYHLCDLSPSCFRLSNLIFHIGNTFLIFIIGSLLLNRRVGFFSATLFSIHPILTEAVVWVSAGSYLEYTFLILVSFLFFILSTKRYTIPTWPLKYYQYFYPASVLFFLLATFTTNRVWGVLIFLIYILSFGNLKKEWVRLLPFFLIALSYLGLQYLTIKTASEELKIISGNDSNFINPFVQIPLALGTLLRLFIWPDKLTFAHVFNYPSINSYLTDLLFNSLICISLIGVTIVSYFKDKKLFFSLAFFLSGIALYLTPLTVSSLVAERYAYFASIGLFIGVGILIEKLWLNKKVNSVALLLFLVVIVSLSIRTYYRTNDWYSDQTLLQSALKINPNIPKIKYELGVIYFNSNEKDKSLDQFKSYLQNNPTSFNANSFLGLIYKDKNDYNQSVFYFLSALKKEPNSIETLQNLAELNYDHKDFDKALEYTKKELVLKPKNSTLFLNLGKIYLNKGDKNLAKENFVKAVELDPKNVSAENYLKTVSLD